MTTRRRTVSSPCSTSTSPIVPRDVRLDRVGVLGLDLDADVDLLGRLALARLQQLEVADEPSGCQVRQPSRLVGVRDLVVEQHRLGDDVRLLADRSRSRSRTGRSRRRAGRSGRPGSGRHAGSRPASRPSRTRATRPPPPGPRGSGRRRTATACRCSSERAPDSAPRRCGAGARCPDRARVEREQGQPHWPPV